MKKWIVALCLSLWGALWASENPFELTRSIKSLDNDINDLIGDLKALQAQDEEDLDDELDEELDDDLDEDSNEEKDAGTQKQERKPSRVNLEEVSETSNEKNDSSSQEMSKKPEEAVKSEEEKTLQRSAEKTQTSESDEDRSNITDEKEKKALVDIDALAETTVHSKNDLRQVETKPSNDTKKKTSVSVAVTDSSPVKEKPSDTKQTARSSAMQRSEAATAKKEDAAVAAKKEEQTKIKAESTKKEEKRTASHKPITIDAIIHHQNGGIANIDLEKEKQEAARRAEEELRKAIAAVDRED
jgi:hypothetical protein